MAVIRGSNYQDDDYDYEDDFPYMIDDMDGCFYEEENDEDDFERNDAYGDDEEDYFYDDDFDDFPY